MMLVWVATLQMYVSVELSRNDGFQLLLLAEDTSSLNEFEVDGTEGGSCLIDLSPLLR
jgi:hypothetical protein